MLFNSYVYICLFLPLVLIGYFGLSRLSNVVWQRAWLVFVSLFFYGWWNEKYLVLLLGSIVFNYSCSLLLCSNRWISYRRVLVALGITGNLLLLAYYKYCDFFIDNMNVLLGTNIPYLHIALPLAISFFTFQQLAFLVDVYSGRCSRYGFLNYCLFVCFFPQLIAGPIVHHSEVMPQFDRVDNCKLQWANVSSGITRFVMGLMKKVMLADTFALYATPGFDVHTELTFGAAWVVALSYTLQIYFDFSGYTDMALGAARMLNIKLPENFLSPYKSKSIQEFWRSWHVTLSRFLRDYVYIPLGGNRGRTGRVLANIWVTFLLGGLWHGAGWTFVIWGGLHAAALSVCLLWKPFCWRLPRFVSWCLTFTFVVVAWVFFRATTFERAVSILAGMGGVNGIHIPSVFQNWLGWASGAGVVFGNTFGSMNVPGYYLLLLIAALFFVVWLPNSKAIADEERCDRGMAVLVAIGFVCSLLLLNRPSEFIYFQF